MSDTLLSYDITTNPDPIQVSPDTGAASLATITIAVSHSPDPKPVTDPDQATGGVPRNSPPVKCTSIIFGIRSGNNAKDLTSDATLAHASAPEGWHIDPDGEGNFTATPIPSPAQITHDGSREPEQPAVGLVFVIHDIPINKLPGRAWLTITETAALGDALQDDRIDTISLGKFPLEFTVGDLNADPQSVALNGSTTLSWSGTEGAQYAIEYDDVSITKTKDGHDLPAHGTYEIEGLQHDTVFNLVVRYGTDPSSIAEIQRSKTVTIVEARIDHFVVEPLTIGKGLPCLVTWETNADKCILDYAGQTVDFVGSNGSTTLKFDATTSVGLTATKGSSQAQDSRSVTVVSPIIKSFTASTTGPISSAETPVTLAWDTQYAETVSLTPDPDVVGPTGSMVVAPVNTTTYTLRCTGLGPDVVQQITVLVRSVVIDSFTVSPAAIDPGGSATLSWQTELATAASIDNGIGSVATIGSVPIPTAPQSDVTYTLTCEGPNGPVSKQVTLTVNSVRIKEFRINVDQWNNPTLVWEVELAQLVELSCNFSGIVSPIPMVAPKGSLPFANNVWEHIVFTLWAMGPGRSPVTATADNGEIPIPNFP